MLLLPPGSAILTGPQDLTALLPPNQYALLPDYNTIIALRYRRLALDPSIFGALILGG